MSLLSIFFRRENYKDLILIKEIYITIPLFFHLYNQFLHLIFDSIVPEIQELIKHFPF